MSEPAVWPVPVLAGSRVRLRPPALADAAEARRIGLHSEVMLGYGIELEEWRELTAAEAAELLANLAPAADKVEWVVEVDGAFIGTARLHSFDEPRRSAAYAVGLAAPEHLGHGLGTAVTRLVSAYAFGGLRLAALTVRVLDDNRRAIGCYTRCGFVLGRREPRALQLHGEWRDDVIMRLDAARYRVFAPSWSSGGDYPEP